MWRWALLSIFVVLAGLAFLYRTSQSLLDTVTFGGVSLTLDYATTSSARERGLGGRTNVPDDYGLLFVFASSSRYGFWMKDMQAPIDIFWLDSAGRVLSIERNVAPSTYPNVFYPPVPVHYVLETKAGFASAHNIATGTPLRLRKFPNVLP